MKTTISVIMPAYNAERTVEESVKSVLAQTFRDFELVIVDDCSQDGTAALCEGLANADPRVRLLRQDENRGVAAARNKGIENARGEWIALLDSDDLWTPEKLEKQLAFIQETGAVISYTASAFIDENGRKKDYILRAERELRYKELLRRNLMSCSSVMVRKDIIKKTPFRAGKVHEDYAAWLVIVRETGAAYGLDEPLLIYRAGRNTRSGRLLRSGMMSYRTYRAVGYGIVGAACLTLGYVSHSLRKRAKMRG